MLPTGMVTLPGLVAETPPLRWRRRPTRPRRTLQRLSDLPQGAQ